MKVYKCEDCGAEIAVSWCSDEPAICKGEHMKEIKPGTTDAAPEKHVPVVQVDGRLVKVTVGEVSHPQTQSHLIGWVSLTTTQGEQLKRLPPHGEPSVTFALVDGECPVEAMAYCNLHGLWSRSCSGRT